MPVSGFGVQNLETLCLSADLAFRIWKRCACQRNVMFKFKNAAFLNEFGVARLETLCVSRDLVFNVSKRCACQRI